MISPSTAWIIMFVLFVLVILSELDSGHGFNSFSLFGYIMTGLVFYCFYILWGVV